MLNFFACGIKKCREQDADRHLDDQRQDHDLDVVEEGSPEIRVMDQFVPVVKTYKFLFRRDTVPLHRRIDERCNDRIDEIYTNKDKYREQKDGRTYGDGFLPPRRQGILIAHLLLPSLNRSARILCGRTDKYHILFIQESA